MKTIITTILIIIFWITSIFIYYQYIWKWIHFSYAPDILLVKPSKSYINIETHLFFPWYVYSNYDYEIVDGKLILWLYKKPRISWNQKNLEYFRIPMEEKRQFKIYYKNPDLSLEYIWIIEFK